jgi:hypothetical protein
MRSEIPPPPTVTLDTREPWLRARCPCGGEYTAGMTTDGDALLIHTIPYCRLFERAASADFLREARESGAEILAHGGERHPPRAT